MVLAGCLIAQGYKSRRWSDETIHSYLDSTVCWQMDKIRNLEENKPAVIYKADNAGAEIFGKVVEKGRHGKLYTLTIRDYGVFMVTKDVYDKVKVGDEVRL